MNGNKYHAVFTNSCPPSATTSDATLTVVSPPTISKSFSPTAILVGSTSTLSFTITNPSANSVSITGVNFTDTLPAGLTITDSSTAPRRVGTLPPTAATRRISLTGASIAANSSCSFNLTVTGSAAGVYNSTTGPVQSNPNSCGSNTASAPTPLTVIGPPSISKGFGSATIPL